MMTSNLNASPYLQRWQATWHRVSDGYYYIGTSTFALTIIVGALFFERAFDQGAHAIYEHINEGKLCKHIKHKYENKE
ncbi:hypothetical protein R6Z07M_000397 [Ovis aries]